MMSIWGSEVRDINLRLHNITSKAPLCNGSEIWTKNETDALNWKRHKWDALRPLFHPTVDCNRNVNICSALKVKSTSKDIKNHKDRLLEMNIQKSSSKANHVEVWYRMTQRWKDQEHLNLYRNRFHGLLCLYVFVVVVVVTTMMLKTICTLYKIHQKWLKIQKPIK